MLSIVWHSSGQLKKNWLSTSPMLISSNMCDACISPPCILTQLFGPETNILRKTSAQIFSWRKISNFWRSRSHEIMDPNYSAPRLLDPALELSAKGSNCLFPGLSHPDVWTPQISKRKASQGSQGKIYNPICLRVTGLSTGRKEAPNQRLRIAWSLCRN